ncbi:hypothetical protein OB2597_14104 [Pseudooceanicola batsensis HTCC2597]|uniref:Glycosyltransferase n=1 Tax=Pseudooceanicola batsensis (strain ATCC BAA-863 / DSM 15984 / KCTC 12145 / HTCC2597) TaxID=252305 RepID=A3U3W1_PSEBH|nr:TIGR04282 family arsenosugar biosynthesis glycosyltransferase [Pseudooceanicola batsensis]EAQ01097.1 hypothetical protein OB2597_14104 [Pseudooceanicola batsensis HTCC2597]
MRRHLVVMVKEPRPGRVKTRLGQEIGPVPAAWWMRHQTARLLRRLRDPRWTLWLAVAPDTAVASRIWPADLPRIAQGRGDLGDRMGRILRGAPDCAPLPSRGPLCIVGSDIPGLGRSQVARAFALLGGHDAVFGPATDGGYWLVGLKRLGPPPPVLFRGVRWSSPWTLADSVATLPGLRVAHADTLSDVDTAADLAHPGRPVS